MNNNYFANIKSQSSIKSGGTSNDAMINKEPASGVIKD